MQYDTLDTCSRSVLRRGVGGRVIKACVSQWIYYTQVKAKYPAQIKVFYSATCKSIEQVPGQYGIEVRASLHGEGREETAFYPRLLVGADGLKSTVGRAPEDDGRVHFVFVFFVSC